MGKRSMRWHPIVAQLVSSLYQSMAQAHSPQRLHPVMCMYETSVSIDLPTHWLCCLREQPKRLRSLCAQRHLLVNQTFGDKNYPMSGLGLASAKKMGKSE